MKEYFQNIQGLLLYFIGDTISAVLKVYDENFMNLQQLLAQCQLGETPVMDNIT
jgi:hypothetical protein